MKAEDTIIKDEVIKVAMSDIKNRWLHSKGKKDTFEHDCFDDIIQTNRFVQADVSFSKGRSEGFEAGVAHAFPLGEQHGIKLVVELIDTKKDLRHEGYHGYAGETPNPNCKGCQIEALLKKLQEGG